MYVNAVQSQVDSWILHCSQEFMSSITGSVDSLVSFNHHIVFFFTLLSEMLTSYIICCLIMWWLWIVVIVDMHSYIASNCEGHQQKLFSALLRLCIFSSITFVCCIMLKWLKCLIYQYQYNYVIVALFNISTRGINSDL